MVRFRCPSVNTTNIGHDLVSRPCVREQGHEGRCDDGHRHRWWTLGSLLKHRGLAYAGDGLVRRADR